MTKATQFLLFVLPREGPDYGVELRQLVNGGAGLKQRMAVRVWGPPLASVVDQVLETLKRSGYRPGEFARTREAPFELQEPWAVRLGLALLAVKPLSKSSRIDRVATAVRSMPDEEVYYWFAKCTAEGLSFAAQRALRTLVAPE